MYSSVAYGLSLAIFLVISSQPTTGKRKAPINSGHLFYGEPIGGVKFSNGKLEVVTSSTQFPYMIEVKHPLIEVCAGALIKRNAAITARHCLEVVDTDVARLKVRAGHLFRDDNISASIQTRNVKEIFRYPKKGGDDDENDLAILQLVSGFRMTDYVNLIELPSHRNDYIGETAVMLGWGITENGMVSHVLRKISLRVLTDKECDKMINATMPRQAHFLCGMHDNKKAVVCGGDSGGPLIIHNVNRPQEDKLIGILSFSYDDDNDVCDSLQPSVTMDIAHYRRWIRSVLDKI